MAQLQIWRDGWTARNSKGHWDNLREATEAEAALAAEHDGMLWQEAGGTLYYAQGARRNSDQLVRVVEETVGPPQ